MNVFTFNARVDNRILFPSCRKWLEKFPWLLASVVYSFLRFIEDHASTSLTKLRQKEVAFVVSLLRERFGDCFVIGRDLVRLLQNVSRIPEIELFWKDILQNPTSLAPNFTGTFSASNLSVDTKPRFKNIVFFQEFYNYCRHEPLVVFSSHV